MTRRLPDPAQARDLEAARLELHFAAQIPAAAGATLLEARDDFSNTALSWNEALDALVTEPLGDRPRAALRTTTGCVGLVDADGSWGASRPLEGLSLAAALAWMGDGLRTELSPPAHGLPDHPIGDGATFPAGVEAARVELTRWFSLAHRLLEELRSGDGDWSPARLWPHHFDLASLRKLDEGAEPESTRSIGAGLSPGDGSYAEPYFYVTPWPYPDAATLPALEGPGRWHTEGFVAAVLPALSFDAHDVEGSARRFLRSAIDACEDRLRA